MKRTLSALCILISLNSIAQQTNNQGFTVIAQQSVDGKQYKTLAGRHVPYANTIEYLSYVPATRRHIGQVSYIYNGSNIEIWQFKGGINDTNLIKILPGTGGTGATGATGLQGIQGVMGITGPQGIQGVQGPLTVSPAGLNWRGTWVSGTSYLQNDAVGYGGSSWFCIAAISGTTTPNLDNTHWALLASQGATGTNGATGIQGSTGLTGLQGTTGSQGITGATGLAGTTGAAGINGTNGTQGIQGLTGATGTQGIQGIQGATGATGTGGAGTTYTFSPPLINTAGVVSPDTTKAQGKLATFNDIVINRPNLIAGTNTTITGAFPNLTFNSTGGAAGNKQQNLSWVNVLDYGADSTGATNNATAFTNAIASFSSAGGTLFIPKGTYLFTTGIVINKPITIIGDGEGATFDFDARTKIISATSGIDVWKIIISGVSIEKVGFKWTGGSRPTSGKGIYVSIDNPANPYPGSSPAQNFTFRDMSVGGFYDDIFIDKGSLWSIDNCKIMSPVRYGIHIENQQNQDNGDWSISNSQIWEFDRSINNIGVHQIGSGGGKIVNTKFQGFKYCLYDSIPTTSILLISNCSFENYFAQAIKSLNTRALTVIGCEFAPYRTLQDTSDININTGKNCTVIGNTFYSSTGGNIGINLKNTINSSICGNAFEGYTTKYTIAGGSGNYVCSTQGELKDSIKVVRDSIAAVRASIVGSNTSWSLGGNPATDPNTNFIGTSDTKDLVIGVNFLPIARFKTNRGIQLHTATANGSSSFANGQSTANGTLSNAFQVGITNGEVSNAFGTTTAKSYLETTFGSYNTSYTPVSDFSWDATDRIFTIGNGTSNAARSDAFTVLKNGKSGFGTSLPTETVDIVGSVKIASSTYTGLVNNATTPVPTGGAGVMVFSNGHFFGWIGTAWKQLDN